MVLDIIAVVTVIGAGVAFLKWKVFGWPVNVTVFQPRANGMQKIRDKAKRVKESNTGGDIYKLKGMKEELEPQQYGDIITDKKGKNHLYLMNEAPGVFKPLKIHNQTTISDDGTATRSYDFTPADEDWRNWHILERNRTDSMFLRQTWFDKYGNIMTFVIIAISISIMAYINFLGIAEVTQKLGNVASSFDHATQSITNAIRVAQGQNVVTTG